MLEPGRRGCSPGPRRRRLIAAWSAALAVLVHGLPRGSAGQPVRVLPAVVAVPGMPELGEVRVLAEFALGLPVEGVSGLPAGYVLQVKQLPRAAGDVARSEAGEADTALQEVRGLQLALPYGAWPAGALEAPTVLVLDAAASAEAGPLALDDLVVLRGALFIFTPTNITLSDASISLPVTRSISRDAKNSSRLADDAVQTLAVHKFSQGRWKRVGGVLRKGLDASAAGLYDKA